jgi:aldehyde dehydrogenase (NAD+)
MPHEHEFFIGGQWVKPVSGITADLVDPSTEQSFTSIAMGNAEDVDRAVKAARAAFPGFAATSVAERLELLRRILAAFDRRRDEMAAVLSREMGAPAKSALSAQVASGPNHLAEMIRTLEGFAFETRRGTTVIRREPIGVCGLITPWNWPVNQIVCKVAPALAAGCTMVLKPSEIAPLNALIFAEILEEAGTPPGVFNLVNGDGPTVGRALSSHPEVDMMSFTGSTLAGIDVAAQAARTVKRVAQELGGKSPNVILPDAEIAKAVRLGVLRCFGNSGQSCSAPTRMLVHEADYEAAAAAAREAAESLRTGAPLDPATDLGPLVSRAQFDKVQRLIEAGIAEGAELITGGPGRPEGLERGYYARPTVFGRVSPEMRIAREEIFGPVLCILTYRDEEEAVRLANDTPYGLAAFVQSGDPVRAARVAARIRAGVVQINYPPLDRGAPFGGYKASGNGREWGEHGLSEFLETKAVIGDMSGA